MVDALIYVLITIIAIIHLALALAGVEISTLVFLVHDM